MYKNAVISANKFVIFFAVLFSCGDSEKNVHVNKMERQGEVLDTSLHKVHEKIDSPDSDSLTYGLLSESVGNYIYTMDCILDNIEYEGGLSLDENDIGNYYNGQLIGTIHGLSASFAFRYMPYLSIDEFRNLTKEEVASIIYSYIYNDNIKRADKKFLFYYVLFTFYYGKETCEYYMCKYYGKEPNRMSADSIWDAYSLSKDLADHIEISFEKHLKFYCFLCPTYATGWRRRYIELKRKHKKFW